MIFGKKDPTDKFEFLNELSPEVREEFYASAATLAIELTSTMKKFYQRWAPVVDGLTTPLMSEIPATILKMQLGSITSAEELFDSIKSPALKTFALPLIASVKQAFTAADSELS